MKSLIALDLSKRDEFVYPHLIDIVEERKKTCERSGKALKRQFAVFDGQVIHILDGLEGQRGNRAPLFQYFRLFLFEIIVCAATKQMIENQKDGG